ncbi:MAG: hypothetical protein SFW67_27565 [Myxococcaceae bacterium]|nr:hypothetical protein [Myxococcaceae bacterium]
MIRFNAVGSHGALVGIGLSFDNLERIEAGEPAFVELSIARERLVVAHCADGRELALLMV